jgi:hypothetical protein
MTQFLPPSPVALIFSKEFPTAFHCSTTFTWDIHSPSKDIRDFLVRVWFSRHWDVENRITGILSAVLILKLVVCILLRVLGQVHGFRLTQLVWIFYSVTVICFGFITIFRRKYIHEYNEDGHKTETCSGYWIKYSNQCCVRRKPWTWRSINVRTLFHREVGILFWAHLSPLLLLSRYGDRAYIYIIGFTGMKSYRTG